jgi:signal peptidase II
MERSNNIHPKLFWSVVASVVVLDVATKLLAFRFLPLRVPQPLLEDWFRLTLVYNRGAAFGLHLGDDSITRIAFTVLTLLALAILWKLYKEARDGEHVRVLAVSLVFAGAIGNLIDRVRWSRGVIDFLDVGIGASRWPTFNIADMAVTTGAISLAVVLWREESRHRKKEPVTAPPGASHAQSSGETAL